MGNFCATCTKGSRTPETQRMPKIQREVKNLDVRFSFLCPQWLGAKKLRSRTQRKKEKFFSDRGHLPLEAAEFGELPEVPFVRREYSDPLSPRARRNQGII